MDAFLGWLQVTAAYAAVGYLGLMVAASLWVSQHPDTAFVIVAATSAAIWWRYGRQIRRFVRVFLIWPPIRWHHRLVRKPIRYLAGGIMARWKRAVIADKLDDTLMKACYEEHLISKQDYRRMSTLIGQALGYTDLVAKKKNQLGVRKRVLANIAELKSSTVESVAATLESLKYRTKRKATAENGGSLNYLKNRKSA